MSHLLRHFAFRLCHLWGETPQGHCRSWRLVSFGVVFLLAAHGLAAPLVIKDDYRSPRNPERRVRTATRLIVLHTTEAHASSALNKLSERGEAHYCVTDKGEIYRIIDREREAFHAGRSMWNAREDCDEYTIGIEVVGYHDKTMPLRQLEALKQLVDQLKKIYKLQDVQVIAHSHVAYGAPNRWYKCKHRGRKRCGMLFAMPSVRTKLGLTARPAYDPDVKAKRLIQADPYLNEVLYGTRDTMARIYGRGKPQLRAAPLATGKAAPKQPVKITPAKPARPKTTAKPAPAKSGAKAAPAKPAVKPTSARPVTKPVVKPTPAKPVAKPVPAKPVPANPIASKPVTKPAPAKSVPTQPSPEKAVFKPGTPPPEEAKPAEGSDSGRSWLSILGLKGGYFQKRAKFVASTSAADEEVPQPIVAEDDEAVPESVKNEVLPLPKNLVIGKMGDDVRDLEVLAKMPGYTRGGPVNATQTPFKIAGKAWNAKTTYYYLPNGKIVRGDQVDEKSIVPGAFIFFKK